MKTIGDWFTKLPAEYCARALLRSDCIDKKVESLRDAVSEGIIWKNTPEGYEFWEGVWLHCCILEGVKISKELREAYENLPAIV
jgi:hypothetical protein